MKLAFHQFRLELRRARIGLSLYGLVLFCSLAVTLGWIGAPALRPDGYWDHGNFFPIIALIAYWVAFTSVVATCVIADSPARRDRFLATRPFPARSLVGGKLLHLALAVILPAVLAEAVALASTGAGAATVIRGGFEHLLLHGTLALAIAAFAAHWKSIQGFLLASIVALVAVMVLGRLVGGLVRSWAPASASQLVQEPTFATILQAVALLAAGLGLTAWIGARRGLRCRFLIPALVPVVAVAAAAMVASPLRGPGYRPAAQETLDHLLAKKDASVRIVQQGYYFHSRDDRSELEASFSVTPHVSGLPDDLELRWKTLRHAWTVDEQVVQRGSQDSHRLAQHYVSRDGVPLSWALAHTIQDHLGTKVLFRLEDQGSIQHSTSLSPQSLAYEPDGPLAGKVARVESLLVADAFRWSLAADLPLEAGQSAHDGASTWQIAGLMPMGGREVHVALSERTVALHTAPDVAHRRSPYPWRERHCFVLCLPDRRLAWFGEPQYPRAVPGVSGATQYVGRIEFRHRSGSDQAPLRNEDLSGGRLLILRSDYAGRFTAGWTSPEFALQDTPSHRYNSSPDYHEHERWSPADFALWFHRGEKLDPDDNDELVQAHFRELFDKLERLDRTLHSLREPAVRYAARFVPRHLDFLLAQLTTAPQRTATFLTNAIALGAEEDQKQAVLASLAAVPTLNDVVELRGWSDEAHPYRVAIVKTSPNSGTRYLDDLLARNDPALDPIVLDAYRATPTSSVYRALRTIPRLADEADAITRELWKPGRVVVQRGRYMGHLEFGLLQGRPEALDELFVLVEHLHGEGGRSWELAQLVANNFHVPKDVRGKHDFDRAYVQWAAEHRASDFRFDPVFRRFVLKAANSTI